MSIEALKTQIAEAKAAYLAAAQDKESVWRPLSNKVRDLSRELENELAKGAYPCRSCGAPAMGMEQPKDIGPRGQPQIITLYEFGCRGPCKPRVLDAVREKAVARWNELYGKAPQ